MQASDKISEACKYPLAFLSFSQGNKYSNLGRSVRFKIAPRVGLALNIHKQDSQLMTKHKMFEGKMTNYLSPSLLKIELVRLLSIWEKLGG